MLYVQAAEQLYSQMIRRFSLRKDVWVHFGLFYFKDNKADMARKLMQRSLKSLDKTHRKSLPPKIHLLYVAEHFRTEFSKMIDIIKNLTIIQLKSHTGQEKLN